jgi:hypothetical protein
VQIIWRTVPAWDEFASMMPRRRMFRRFRAALGYLLAAWIVLGSATLPSNVLCVEAGGRVDIEPINAACCSGHFHYREAQGLHSCGHCSDTVLSIGLDGPNSHSFSPAFPVATFIIRISIAFRSALAVGLEFSKLPRKKVRPAGIVLRLLI